MIGEERVRIGKYNRWLSPLNRPLSHIFARDAKLFLSAEKGLVHVEAGPVVEVVEDGVLGVWVPVSKVESEVEVHMSTEGATEFSLASAGCSIEDEGFGSGFLREMVLISINFKHCKSRSPRQRAPAPPDQPVDPGRSRPSSLPLVY